MQYMAQFYMQLLLKDPISMNVLPLHGFVIATGDDPDMTADTDTFLFHPSRVGSFCPLTP